VSFWEFLGDNSERLLLQTIDHILISVIAVAIGALIGVSLGVLTYRKSTLRVPTIATVGLILTIPSLALYALMVGIFGIGATPVMIALVLYSLMPITRNTVTGLVGVDQAIVEAAQGMGLGRWRRLFRIELPLAWPVILTGIRISTILIVGIAALGAVVNGPGLGITIREGLLRIGSPGSLPLNMALAGTLLVALLGILLDLLLTILARITTPRGARA
jgi:osmoprotectant transport system permease protein